MACRASAYDPASAAGCGHVTKSWPMALNGCVVWHPLGNFLGRQLVTICPFLCSAAEVLREGMWKRAEEADTSDQEVTWGHGLPVLTPHTGEKPASLLLDLGHLDLCSTQLRCLRIAAYRRKPSGRQDHLETHSQGAMERAGLFLASLRPASSRSLCQSVIVISVHTCLSGSYLKLAVHAQGQHSTWASQMGFS